MNWLFTPRQPLHTVRTTNATMKLFVELSTESKTFAPIENHHENGKQHLSTGQIRWTKICFFESTSYFGSNIFGDRAKLLGTFRRNKSKFARIGRFLTCKTFISDERFPHKMENLSKQLFPLLLTQSNKSEKNRCKGKTLKKYFWLKCIFITSIHPFALMSIRRKEEIE